MSSCRRGRIRYVATKSQNEVIHGEPQLEKVHVDEYPEEELSELDYLMNFSRNSKRKYATGYASFVGANLRRCFKS